MAGLPEPRTRNQMAVATIIVNYQTAPMVLAHLPALRAEMATVPGSRAYIVDNASPTGDAETLARAVADMADVTVIAAPENGGFSYGNNRGFEQAKADGAFDNFFMLNPDAYPRPGCFQTLLTFFDQHQDAGIVAPRLEGEDGTAQRSAFNYPTVANEFLGRAPLGTLFKLVEPAVVAPPVRSKAHPCDWVAGAAVMIRGDALEQVGPMDERYFLYFEEVDHQRAFHEAGFSVWYEPAAVAVHLVGQATGIVHGRQSGGVAPPYWYDSRRRYFLKHHGQDGARWADRARGAAFRLQDWRDLAAGKSVHRHRDETEQLSAARQRMPAVTVPSDRS